MKSLLLNIIIISLFLIIGIFYCRKNFSPISTDFDELQINNILTFDSILVGLYIDNAVWNDCKTSTENMLKELKISYHKINHDSILTGCLRHYSVLFLPGGRPDLYCDELGIKGINFIKNYIKMGGGYIGICGSGFIAAQTNIWRGWAGEPRIYYKYQGGLGIFKGTADGPIDDFAPTYRDLNCRINILNQEHPISAGLPEIVSYIYDHGPEFISDDDTSTVIIGKSLNGDHNIILCTKYYNGNIFLSSGHPEFDVTRTTWQMVSNAITWCSKLN